MVPDPDPSPEPEPSPFPLDRLVVPDSPSFGLVFAYVYAAVLLASLILYIVELAVAKHRESRTLPHARPPADPATAATGARTPQPYSSHAASRPRTPRQYSFVAPQRAAPSSTLASTAAADDAADPSLPLIPGLLVAASAPEAADESCMVCLEPLAGRPVAAAACLHWVHAACMLHWLAGPGDRACMACRAPLDVPSSVRARIVLSDGPDGAGGTSVVYSIADDDGSTPGAEVTA